MDKPQKPYPDFPLFPHATRRWAKKIRGKLHYFGSWRDPDAALNLYLQQRDDLHAGRVPRAGRDGLTVRNLLNRFLTAKQRLADSREIKQRTFNDYHTTCARIGEVLGLDRFVEDLGPDDFDKLRASFAKTWGPVALGNEIQRTRVVFKFAVDAGLVPQPVRFGPGFRKPSNKVLRIARAGKGLRLFEPKDLRTLIEAANVPMRAMILLGLNCGFGNADAGRLPLDALDLAGGWINFPRPKTGVHRRCPLWPETVAALEAVLAVRRPPIDEAHADQVFVTQARGSWAKDIASNPVSDEMRKLLKATGQYREGLSFYSLRHTFRTIADEARDQVAINLIMGHADTSMANVYREKVGDDRLLAVTNHIRNWLFPKED